MDMKRPAISPSIVPGTERMIGVILTESGRLLPEDAERILRYQENAGLRFGEAGKRLRLLSEEDVRYALAQQFEYPSLSSRERDLDQELIAAFRPSHSTVEALRALRSQILLRWLNGEPNRKAITVTSTCRREGRSFIAGNLAVVFSQLGERTLLIDADLRNPRQHHLFKLENRVGLSGMLAGRVDANAIVRIGGMRHLSVLPSGPQPPNPQELLSKTSFSDLLQRAASAYDVVIIDSPAWETGADAQVIAARAGAALLVTRPNVPTVRATTEFCAALTDVQANVLGATINDY